MKKNVSEEIINKALVTYIAKNTRYLTQAQVYDTGDGIRLDAQFSIKESCYLSPGSGHFNAVEALMCFNQMLYVAVLGFGNTEKCDGFVGDIKAFIPALQ